MWRGEQYERAIGMYFQKFGRYPTKIDDLTKQTNGVRFLRQAYTDPMNKEDGCWRFIYVGPNGQLIGSLHGTSLLQAAFRPRRFPARRRNRGCLRSATALGSQGNQLGSLPVRAGQSGQQTSGGIWRPSPWRPIP